MSEHILQTIGLEAVMGTQLEPFLRGFKECGFKFDVDVFIEKHKHAFAVACPDGSHPLVWTTIHHEYKKLFDAQLETILEYHCDREIKTEEFIRFCSQLASLARNSEDPNALLPGMGGVRVADFDRFVHALTASEDYGLFLQVMFRAAGHSFESSPSSLSLGFFDPIELRSKSVTQPNKSGGTAMTASQIPQQEIEVVVPEGYSAGQVLAVDFLGCRYELAVPEGCLPGRAFRALIQAPPVQEIAGAGS